MLRAMATPTDPDRPLRRDALRNIERICAAAVEVFRERGLDASHEVIAGAADVSVGTVYRRFPDREQLIDLVFERELDAVVAVMEEALALDDPWAGIVHLFERGMELSVDNVGLGQLMNGSQHGAERVQRARDRLGPMAAAILERAREAGAIRPDAAAVDLPVIQLMLSTIVDAGRTADPQMWRRYLALILDGLRPEGQPRGELPAAISLDTLDEVVAAHHGVAQRAKAP